MISFDTVINPDAFLTFLFRSKKKFLRTIKGFEKKNDSKRNKSFWGKWFHRNMYNKYMDAYAGSVYF